MRIQTDERHEGDPIATVIATVGSWEGVRIEPHRFGGVEFLLGRRELGHLHAGRRPIADLPFPRRVRDELLAEGRVRRHHVLPDSGWATAPLESEADAGNVIELLRLNHDRAARARERLALAAG